MALVDDMVMLRAEAQERLCRLVYPLGFDTMVHLRADPGTVAAVGVFRCNEHPHREIKMVAEFQASILQTKERWRCSNTVTDWYGPVCDTPEAAFVAAELANWGRAGGARDYSQSSEV